MAQPLDRLWQDYAEHHRAEGNKWCHTVGIPLIIAGLLSLLAFPVAQAGTLPVEASLLLIVAAGAVYLWLDLRLGLAMIAACLVLYLGVRLLPAVAAWALFILGWVIQFIGHGVYEKRSPAFLQNLAHLLIGPLWVLNHALRLR